MANITSSATDIENVTNILANTQIASPPNLNSLLDDVFIEIKRVQEKFGENVNRDECLRNVIRWKHYFPQLQVKTFFDKSGLTLLHNTYKRTNVSHFDQLYSQCRSVVIDLHSPQGKNVIVSLSSRIPERMCVDAYKLFQLPTDKCEMAFEGTTIAVYYHDNVIDPSKSEWKFGTSSCPTIDSSKYFHPTKTHGQMFDETLVKLLDIDDEVKCLEGTTTKSVFVRDAFTKHLHKENTYMFLLIHHENKHLTDHSDQFGDEYMELVHIDTTNRESMFSYDLSYDENHIDIPNLLYSRKFDDSQFAINWLDTSMSEHTHGFIVKRENGVILKVSSSDFITKEEENLGHPNPWHNMLWVYCKNNPQYKVDTYMRKYLNRNDIKPVYYNGQRMSPTFIIHTSICSMRDVLLNLYNYSTEYNVHTKRYTVNKEIDSQYSNIVRFHLAQLRFIQISTHTHKPIDSKCIYHYLCIHNSTKNQRILINHFAQNDLFGIPIQNQECIRVLDRFMTTIVPTV